MADKPGEDHMGPMESTLYQQIEIGGGLGDLKFGFTTEEARRHLGSPDETEFVDPGSESTVMWYYEGLKLQIVFQRPWAAASEPWRITQLTSRHPAITLWGESLLGRPEHEVLSLFRNRGYDMIEHHETPDASGYQSFRLDKVRVHLDFRDGLLRLVLWGDLEGE